MYMSLQVLIATMNQTDEHFYEKIFVHQGDKLSGLIINQITEMGMRIYETKMPLETNLWNISWINTTDKGLSLSRNAALSNAVADIGVIADDDVTYIKGFQKKILHYHEKYDDYDILIFKARDPGGRPFRVYPDEIRELRTDELGGVASIEMTLKVKNIREKKLFFDVNFGLGAGYPASEEWIFLVDAQRRGAKILFIPEYIVEHPVDNSGNEFNKKRIIALGAALYRIYGNQAYLRWLAFPKNIRPKIHFKYHSALVFFYFFLKGIISFQVKKRSSA